LASPLGLLALNLQPANLLIIANGVSIFVAHLTCSLGMNAEPFLTFPLSFSPSDRTHNSTLQTCLFLFPHHSCPDLQHLIPHLPWFRDHPPCLIPSCSYSHRFLFLEMLLRRPTLCHFPQRPSSPTAHFLLLVLELLLSHSRPVSSYSLPPPNSVGFK
jgi:hypothetical protein